jgi:hypothetical protein
VNRQHSPRKLNRSLMDPAVEVDDEPLCRTPRAMVTGRREWVDCKRCLRLLEQVELVAVPLAGEGAAAFDG